MFPLVTIIMVVYNSEEFLEEAISSVLKTEYKNIELIISDDCSKDSSWNIISKFNDPRIKSFRQRENLGEYQNRKFCINQAKGKYFVFIDGDDVALQKGLEEAVTAMDDNESAAIGLVRPTEEGYVTPYLLPSKEAYKRHYFDKSPLNLSFARNIFRTAVVVKEKKCFPVNLYSGDDFIRLYLASKYNCVVLSIPFAKWRSRPGQASKNKDKFFKGLIEPHRLNAFFLANQNCPLSKTEKKKARARIRYKMLLQSLVLFKNGSFRYSLRLLPYVVFVNRRLSSLPLAY